MIYPRSKLILLLAVICTELFSLWLLGRFEFVRAEETIPARSSFSVPVDKKVSFIIGGDMMFGRDILYTFGVDKLSESVKGLKGVFDGYDARIVNLEGAISKKRIDEKKFAGYPHSFSFIFQPEVVSILSSLGINAVSLANNHSINAGTSGLNITRELLGSENIQAIGGPYDDDTTHFAVFGTEDFPLTVIGVNCTFSKPDIEESIKVIRADNPGRIIVYAHWGDEYKTKHNKIQQELAHAWIDAGADMVVGAHPHVVEDTELYNGKPIFYSLGNLLFDQWFSDETQHGMMIAGTFSSSGLEFRAIPTAVFEKGTIIDKSEKTKSMLEDFYSSFSDYKVTTQDDISIVIPNSVR